MNPYIINPPESEVVFEELCLELLKLHWSRKGLERFAKKGEDQYGVDIFDTLGETPQYAAQCKLKEQWKSLEPNEIRTEEGEADAVSNIVNTESRDRFFGLPTQNPQIPDAFRYNAGGRALAPGSTVTIDEGLERS